MSTIVGIPGIISSEEVKEIFMAIVHFGIYRSEQMMERNILKD